ncbi:MAG: alpha/beta hydrolase [Ilumatobacteraceae bacterium]
MNDQRPEAAGPHDGTADGELAEPTGRRLRWWPLALGVAIVLVVVWAFATAWVGIWGSSPAYLLTLLLALGLAIGLIVWAVLVGPPSIRSPRRVWLARGALVLGGAVLIGSLVYLRPLSAEPIAVDALSDGDGVSVDVSRTTIRLTPDADPRSVGLAFYPGAKVDPQAYAHILRPLAQAGFPVVIFKQPYNLAVLQPNAANAVIGDPDDTIDRWVVGGHSLGGAMASSYAEQDRDELSGLLLYAAYPANDMSERTDLAVMSVYGTNDGLATPADIEERAPDLPASTEYVAIEGAIHSYFGDYGLQRGDGTPGVSRTVAQREIADASLLLLEAVERE